MANVLKIKRSAVEGKIPAVGDLALGELAINTYDGRLYSKQDNGVESIVEFGSNDFQIVAVEGGTNIVAGQKADTLNITKNDNSSYENIVLTSTPGTNTLDISLSDTPEVLELFFDTTGSTTDTMGQMCWNVDSFTVDVNLGHGVIGQMFQEIHCPLVKNLTGVIIPDGTPVVTMGVDVDDIPYVVPFIADGTHDPRKYLGVTTEPIGIGEIGVVTHFGRISGLDTSAFTAGDTLYASTTVAGGLTATKPTSPDYIIEVGCVIKSDVSAGILQVRRTTSYKASEISYDNTDSELLSTNVQTAIDELQLTKASVSLLSSNITLYRTTASSVDVPGYFTLVTSTEDPDYNTIPVDVSTGAITTTNQLLASYIAQPGLFIGNPGVITITTIVNIERTTGNNQQYADFYFELYKRDSLGTETLITTSGSTGVVNPLNNNVYYEYTCSAVLNDGEWLETDRIVLKSYGNLLGVSGPVYNFEFGGDNPFRNLLPVPVSVIPSAHASDILTDTSTFNNILSGDDGSVQSALETIDNNAVHNSTTISAGSGLTGGGDLTTNRVISHADTSSATNLSATYKKPVDSLTFDTFGHVTGYSVSTQNTSGTLSGTSINVDASAHAVYTLSMSGAPTITFTNAPAAGNLCEFSIIIVGDGNNITWGSTINWPGDEVPWALDVDAIGYFTFKSIDGGTVWYGSLAGSGVGAGATGGNGDQVFVENDMIVTADYTITSGKSASSVGPITINDGVTVTIPDGSRWVIL